ncbi:Hypothetical protein PHPALM_20344, partial [Phytophthora palmivora]
MPKVNDHKRFLREFAAVLAITTLEEEDKQDIKNEKQLLFSKNVLVEFNDEWRDSDVSSSEDDEDQLFDTYNSDDDDDPFVFRRLVKYRVIAKGHQPVELCGFVRNKLQSERYNLEDIAEGFANVMKETSAPANQTISIAVGEAPKSEDSVITNISLGFL